MNLSGQVVNHIKFGKGKVLTVSENRIEVDFTLGRKKLIIRMFSRS